MAYGKKIIKGFTLAEVLITLGIIGVVAAMTIPTLMANNQKQQYVTQLKQVYSEIGSAIKIMMVDEGVNKLSDTDILTSHDDDGLDAEAMQRAGQFLNKYFKVIKDCGDVFPNPCLGDLYSTYENLYASEISRGYCVIISSGATICVNPATQLQARDFTVDVNGPKKPNKGGRDIFVFDFYYDGSVGEANPECRKGLPNQNGFVCGGAANASERLQGRADNCINSNYGAGCFSKMLLNGWKMDY